MGVSGSGKSAVGGALAAALGMPYHEGDSDHPPANVEKMKAGTPLDDNDRYGWLLALRDRIRRAGERNQGLVLSCSALKRRYRDLLREGDPDLIFLHLDGSRELIAARMQARSGHFMPPALLDSQLRDLEPPQADERALRLDISETPQALVKQAIRHFRSQR
jgi:gluconokinase